MKFLAILLLLTATASAADFPINDKDQAAVQQICDLAAASPSLNRDSRAAIANWCVMWANRVADAAKPKPPEDKKDK